ncbi:dUTPase [Staphylococcus pseudintermedius]|uniref:dUTPase n=1 Tax=Staphylococcus pseudintermedius TaxID=283734 RepID=UPI000BBBF454|nr:dUTPase [Staphylococcus pseudintermedius]EGQ3753903.1 dUTPase [Staphylococcus pseudintermedius]EHD0645768.1 dUTPase [Staphylococcus pseudintermedius]MBM0304131.1 dUTPase [Staphylococcus pseudintermedius]MCE5509068.1 dUTPase [Staphylococcus pseudintermedius]MCE5560191.1 dUTPase [Staphylococcus pseudintermedius]
MEQLTVKQLQELLQIQKEFDDRIPTLNIEDSKIAYVVEFFEWFNTLETFKNWKKRPGKPLDVQLDELADLLAFGLSIANQTNVNVEELEGVLTSVEQTKVDFSSPELVCSIMHDFSNFEIDGDDAMLLPFNFASNLYTIDQLITAYKKKMEINHARQDGTADAGKGYV